MLATEPNDWWEEPAMSGFTLAAAASIAAGLSIGAAVTVGVTLAVEDHDVARAERLRTPSAPHLVQYGDRCYAGVCLPPIPQLPQLPQLPPIPQLPQLPQLPQIP
jgi:hypothetical protein